MPAQTTKLQPLPGLLPLPGADEATTERPAPLQALPGLSPLPDTQGNIPDQPPARAGFGGVRPIPGLEPLPGTQGANVQDALRSLPTAPPGLTPLPAAEETKPSEGPWYSRAWDAANTPLTTTLFGLEPHRQGATGWEKGLEDFGSSFTSPLSLALLIGTMGSSALFESGGAAALRAAGMGAEEIAQTARGTQVIARAVKAGQNSAEALQAAGISPTLMSKAVSTLRAAGLSSESMTTHGLVGGGINSGLRAMGVGVSNADKIGKGIQLGVDLGFKAQGAWQAIQDSPRLLDALKEGDYETAKEMFVHVALGAGQAAIGGTKFLKDAGSSIDDLGEKFGFKVKMTAENQKLRDNYGIYQADKTQAQQAGKVISDELRAKYDKLDKADREGVFYLIQANRDPEILAKRLNLLAEAAGRDSEKVPEPAAPLIGPAPAGVMKVFHGTSGEGPLSITQLDAGKFAKVRGVGGIGTYVSTDPTTASQYVGQNEGGKVIAGVLHPNVHLLNATQPLPLDISRTLADAFAKIAKQVAPEEGAANAFERYSAETAAAQGKPFAPKALTDPSLTYVEMIDATRRMLADANQDVRKGLIKFQSALGREGYDGVSDVYPGRPVIALFPKEVTGRSIEEMLKPASPVKGLTADEAKLWNTDAEAAQIEREARYRELAGEQRLAKSYKPKEIDALLTAYKRAYNATPEMRLLAKELGGRFAESLERAQAKGVIGQGIRDYVTQLWKPEENPAANALLHDAHNGTFTTNVSMARHRMFESAFEGQLLGRKLAVTDPITLVGNHISKVGQAIAARDFMERLADKNVRASDGRPMVALAGHGQLVEGENGENPAVLVNPDRIRNVRIADARVKQLEKSGDLDRLIEEGKIVAYPATPKSIIKGQGLIYKGELSPGTGVHQFEHPAHPGITAALNGGKNGITSESVAARMTDKLREFGRTAELKGAGRDEHYFWNTHDYQTIDHSAFHDWNFGAQAPDGTPVMVKSELRVHPEAYEYLNRLIGPGSLPSKNPIVQALLGVGGEAKHLTLSLSPFHIFQEGLRAIMSGVSPFGIEKWDLRNDPDLYRLVRAGMTLGKDQAGVQDFAEGVVASGRSKILGSIPVVRDVQNWMQTFLFDKYIPGLKARAGKALYDRYLRAATDADGNFRPGWNADRVARTTAEDANERFGGINYKQLGRSAGAQDTLRLAALAPDWLESEMRFAKRAVTGGVEGTIARRDMVRMAAGLWVAARVLNYLTTGQPHNEAPFGVAVQDREGHEKVYSIRTLPTDMLHMMHDPVDFLRGRISPLGKMATEAITGRDRFGRKLTPFQQIVDVTRGTLPIPVQLVGQAATGTLPSGLTNVDQAVKAAGFTATPYRTEAQKLAIQLASNRSESGSVDMAQLGRHQAKIEFEDRLRAGSMKPEEIHQMVEDGHLSIKEGKEIIKNAGETAGMDADMAALYSRALHLPMKDFLQVWDAATNSEKAALSRLMLKKKQSYFKSAHNSMAPEERKRDPTYRRLRSMFPNEAPW